MAQYDCLTCNDEKITVWDDDQSRHREVSFFIGNHDKMESCPDCTHRNCIPRAAVVAALRERAKRLMDGRKGLVDYDERQAQADGFRALADEWEG